MEGFIRGMGMEKGGEEGRDQPLGDRSSSNGGRQREAKKQRKGRKRKG